MDIIKETPRYVLLSSFYCCYCVINADAKRTSTQLSSPQRVQVSANSRIVKYDENINRRTTCLVWIPSCVTVLSYMFHEMHFIFRQSRDTTQVHWFMMHHTFFLPVFRTRLPCTVTLSSVSHSCCSKLTIPKHLVPEVNRCGRYFGLTGVRLDYMGMGRGGGREMPPTFVHDWTSTHTTLSVLVWHTMSSHGMGRPLYLVWIYCRKLIGMRLFYCDCKHRNGDSVCVCVYWKHQSTCLFTYVDPFCSHRE